MIYAAGLLKWPLESLKISGRLSFTPGKAFLQEHLLPQLHESEYLFGLHCSKKIKQAFAVLFILMPYRNNPWKDHLTPAEY